jgi:hypothetical protein
MTMQEYKEEMKILAAKYEDSRRKLIKKYADANNPYKEGDIIEDHIGRGEIISIGYFMSFDTPQCVYRCKVVNKDGSYSKRDNVRAIYRSNLKHNSLNHNK